jgi:hypothetical protein
MVALPGEPGLVPARLAGRFMAYVWSGDDNGFRDLLERSQKEEATT